MDDEALLQILRAIEDRVVAAQGEAIFAGLMISSLTPVLIAKGLLGRGEVERIIDNAILILESHRGPMNEGAQLVIDHARSRLEVQLSALKAAPP